MVISKSFNRYAAWMRLWSTTREQAPNLNDTYTDGHCLNPAGPTSTSTTGSPTFTSGQTRTFSYNWTSPQTAATPLYQLGVEFSTSGAWNGTDLRGARWGS